MDVLSVGMLNLDGPNADLHLRYDRAGIFIMSNSSDLISMSIQVVGQSRPVNCAASVLQAATRRSRSPMGRPVGCVLAMNVPMQRR
jgi:hypothetical protein